MNWLPSPPSHTLHSRMRHSLVASCVLVAWLLLGAGSVAFGQQYPFILIPGSPKAVKTLFQDSRGRLWLGGSQVACFDGSRFFFLRDYGLPAAESYDITEDSSGAIWIGAETGVYRFASGRVEEISKGVAVSVIAAAPDVVIAAVGPLGQGTPATVSLVRIQRTGNSWKSETITSLDSPGRVTLDHSGNLLYPWPEKGWNEMRLQDVLRWHAGTTLPVTRHPIPNAPGNGSMKVMRDDSGCLWMGSEGGDTYDCGDGPHAAPFTHARVRSDMHRGSDGTMVLWGDSLLAVGRPGSFRIATPANGMPGLWDAIPARDGTVWLATPEGLYRFASPFRIEYWTAREGLPNAPWSVARSGGRVYAGLDSQIAALSRDRLRWGKMASFPGAGIVTSLLGAQDGTLLASFISGGAVLVRSNGRALARTDRNPPLSGSMRLARTSDGEIWLGGNSLGRITRSGSLLRFEDHHLQTQPPGNVLAIKYEGHTQKLWACYNGGIVVRNHDGTWQEITTRNGLLVNGCWSLAPLPNGDVWDAYYNLHTIALIRPDAAGRFTIRQYGSGDGIPEPGNVTFDADHYGKLWRAGDLGIYVADPAEAEAGNWLKLDESDGFPANDINTGSFFADPDGSLWWGADNDLAHYTPPSDLVTPKFAPQVFLSSFSWNGGSPKMAEAVEGVPHGSAVVAHIGSLQFDRRNTLRLRYRVLPGQADWRESSSLDLSLGSLSWGTHTLEVQGRVFTGPWSETVKRSFTVFRPIWLTWPFVLAYFMAATLLPMGAYLLQRRRRAEEVELLPNLAAWRLGALLPEVHELAGAVLDSRFEVGEILARGGFATVMAGYDCDQKQRCAIKIFRNEVRDKTWVQRRFEQEVAALQQVRHPNVVSIYAQGATSSGAPYLVMEFVDGRSLREVIEDGALPPERVAGLLLQLVGALEAIHRQNIWHRDVKPENVMIRKEGTPEEEAVLIDFSIAIVKVADDTLQGLSRAAGTFDYMAPEQAIGYAQPSSDIYSLAKLILEMLTGRRLSELLPDAAMDLPDRVRGLAGGLDVNFSQESIEMLATALEFDPAKRPADVRAFAKPIVRDLESRS
jgi:ligand-binding sensor domain-containing protein/tRNA A-37 threonylcarbamoyl transferase component Bud32